MGSLCLLGMLVHDAEHTDNILAEQPHQEPALVCNVHDSVYCGEGKLWPDNSKQAERNLHYSVSFSSIAPRIRTSMQVRSPGRDAEHVTGFYSM